MGRTLSHRLLIIKLWAQGKEYSEIAKSACHSLNAIQNYVAKFKRTISLSKEGYDVNRIAFILRISASLVEQYLELYQQVDLVPHRHQELNSLLKKNSTAPFNQEGQL
jgi:transposase